MKHINLGTLEVSRIGLGAMGMSGVAGAADDDAESIRTIHRALDLGVTLLDTAEIYGPFANEELVGAFHEETIAFLQIVDTVELVLDEWLSKHQAEQ